MNARPLAVVVQRNSQADHRFPEMLAQTLSRLGWQVEWLAANLNRQQLTKALDRLRQISSEPVFFTVNYRPALAKWLSFEGLTCITWNEVFPISYKDVTAMQNTKNFWFFGTSDRVMGHFASLGVQTHFMPWGFDPTVFNPRSQEVKHDLSFVGSGLSHMEAQFSRCMASVCDELEAAETGSQRLRLLEHVARFFQLFMGLEWKSLENYRGNVGGLFDAYCASVHDTPEMRDAVAAWLHEHRAFFLGQYARLQRVESVRVASSFDNFAIYGNGWEGLELESWLQYPIRYNDTPDVFRSSKINLHLHRLYVDGVNDRMMNVPACEALLLTRSTPQLERVLEPDEHFVGYQTVDEMKGKIDWLLNDEAARKRIAKAGREFVVANFSIDHQLRKIAKIVGLPDPLHAKRQPKGASACDLEVTPLKKVVKMAVIGHGTMGRHHARVIDQLEGAELVAVSDARVGALQGLEQRYACRVYSDYEKLLETESLDAVSIAVPTSRHQEVARAALARGIHVLVEKPIASSVEQALEIEALAMASDAKLMVGHIERFNPAIRELKARLDKGELGEIFQLEACRQGPYPARIMDVGAAVDLAVHDIDIIRYLTGNEVTQVYAHAQDRIQGPHEDAIHGLLKMRGGQVANLSVNWVTPTKIRRISVLGERGMFVVDYISQDLFFYENGFSNKDTWQAVSLFRGVGEGQMIRHHIPRSEPLRNEIEHFVQCIQENRDPITTANDGLRALTIAESLLESSRLGTSLDLEFSKTGSHLCIAA